MLPGCSARMVMSLPKIQSAEDGFVADAQLVVAAGRRVGGAEGHARRDLLTGIEVHDIL